MMDAPSNPAAVKHAMPLAAVTSTLPKWRVALAAFVLAFVALLAMFSDTVQATVSTWLYSETFNHGFLIPALVIYLVWRRRDALAAVEPRFEPLGLLPVGVAMGVWLVGQLSETTIIQQIGLVLLIQSLVLCMFGRQVMRLLVFPLFYLIFAVPFGEEFVPHLQGVTAFFVVFFLQHVGIPVFNDGVFISTPAGTYLVAEACAGLRYLISTIALGAIFAHLAFHTWWRRALFIALSLTVPILANGVRAFLIVYIAYLSNNEIATGIDHIIYGWIFFSLVTFMLLGLGFMMREAPPEEKPPLSAPAAARTIFAPALGAAAVVLIAFATSAYADWATRPLATAEITDIAWPAMRGFTQLGRGATAWAPRFVGADKQIGQVYRGAGHDIDIDIGLYNRERPGAKAITASHEFADDHVWKRGDAGLVQIEIGGQPVMARSLRLTAAGRYRLIWYWYWAGGAFTGNPYVAKWLKTKALLLHGSGAVGVMAVSTEYPSTLGEPTRLLHDFVAALPQPRLALERAVRH